MFIQCVVSIGSGRIGRTGQYIGMLADDDDVRSVTSSRSFCVITLHNVTLDQEHVQGSQTTTHVWIVLPLKAPMVVSTKPDSFSVSVWMLIWTS